MQNLVLSPIDPDIFVKNISNKVTANILEALKADQATQQPAQSNDPMNIDQAAEFLGLKKATLYVKVSRNEIPNTHRNGRLYFFRDELLSYLKEGKRQSESELQAKAKVMISKKERGNNGK